MVWIYVTLKAETNDAFPKIKKIKIMISYYFTLISHLMLRLWRDACSEKKISFGHLFEHNNGMLLSSYFPFIHHTLELSHTNPSSVFTIRQPPFHLLFASVFCLGCFFCFQRKQLNIKIE